MNRRSYLKSAGVAATAGLLAGCSGPGASADAVGTLAASVTDQPADIADFESCIVTIAGIWVSPAGGDDTDTPASTGTESTPTSTGSESGDRRYIEFEEARTADLVQLQGANSQSLGEWELETGSYESLQLDVTGVEGTLDDGSEADIDTPGNAPLQFNTTFEIRAEETTRFVADFTPVRQGNTGRYLIQPVASGTVVLYGTETYSGGEGSMTTEEATTDGDDTAGGNRTTAAPSGN